MYQHLYIYLGLLHNPHTLIFLGNLSTEKTPLNLVHSDNTFALQFFKG